jgi:polyhydroxybutyrate depolymerase
MKLARVLLPLSLFGFSCAPATPAKVHLEPGRYVRTIKVGQLERNYILRVPKNYDNATNLPLVFVLHGWSSSAREAEVNTGFAGKADKEGFILVLPDGTPAIGDLKGWNSGALDLGSPKANDVKLIGDLIEQLERDYYVDRQRVYVAGHSNGAMMAYDVGAQLGDKIAAIAVVSGTVGGVGTHVPDPKSPVSAIIFHGKQDETVPYDANSHALITSTPAPESAKWWADKIGCRNSSAGKLDGCALTNYKEGRDRTEVEFVTIPDGDHSWPSGKVKATDMIWDFFKAHPKP